MHNAESPWTFGVVKLDICGQGDCRRLVYMYQTSETVRLYVWNEEDLRWAYTKCDTIFHAYRRLS